VNVERNDNHRNGVSTLDLVRIQKHLLGRESFSNPYQYIAADANNSETVSAIDIVELRRLILGEYDELPRNKSWRFVDKKFTFPDPTHPWPFNEFIYIKQLNESLFDNDFVGVKIGDVNSSVKANANEIKPREGRRILPIAVTSKEIVTEGELFDITFHIPEALAGFQWTLALDGIELTEISSPVIDINEQHIGFPKKNIVTMSWNGNVDTVVNGMEVKMTCRANKPRVVKETLKLNSSVTEAECYTTFGEILDPHLQFNIGINGEFALYQNEPNPWKDLTVIGFDLPDEGLAKLSIFDVSGKLIRVVENEYKAGYNSIALSAREFEGSGLFYYKLEIGGYVATKKMMMVK
jgi:hypothetical protein